MSKIIGIDLGTTNSVVAIMENGRPKIIKDKEKNTGIIPSVVGILPTGDMVVGAAARAQYISSPENTVRSIKRKMGKDEKVKMAGKEYTPAEISAMILAHMKRIAEAYLGEKVEKAVITVPAYFSDSQRQATKDAGEIAGLEVVRIINEPTAAALAYGIDRQKENQYLLVYDLGGGTFDVSVIEKVGEVIEVRASHGNNFLGGDDFDIRLQNHALQKLQEKYPKLDVTKDLKAMARLNMAVEAAKIELSSKAFTKIFIENLTKKGLFSAVHLDMEVARGEFVGLIQDLLDSTKESIDLALKDAELKPQDIDKILLVGGSTRIPAVWELIHHHMGKTPHADVNPDEAVALGAAVQAGIIAGEKIQSVLVDVCPYTLGVEYAMIKGGKIIPGFYKSLIKRNTTIPTSVSEAFYTVYPEQDIVEINVYQGDYQIANMNTPVGEFRFSGISPAEEEGMPREVVIQFDYDVDGILHVSAIDRKASRKEEGLRITESQIKMSEEAKGKARNVLADLETNEDERKKVLDKLHANLVEFHKTLKAANKEGAVIQEVGELLAKLDAARKEGKADVAMLNRISDLMYDHDFEPK